MGAISTPVRWEGPASVRCDTWKRDASGLTGRRWARAAQTSAAQVHIRPYHGKDQKRILGDQELRIPSMPGQWPQPLAQLQELLGFIPLELNPAQATQP